jgi:hypothetical protein
LRKIEFSFIPLIRDSSIKGMLKELNFFVYECYSCEMACGKHGEGCWRIMRRFCGIIRSSKLILPAIPMDKDGKNRETGVIKTKTMTGRFAFKNK